MSAESGPIGGISAGIGGFSAGGEVAGFSPSSIGTISTGLEGGMSSGYSIGAPSSGSEGSISSSLPSFAKTPSANSMSFSAFESYAPNPLGVSVDSAFHGDLSELTTEWQAPQNISQNEPESSLGDSVIAQDTGSIDLVADPTFFSSDSKNGKLNNLSIIWSQSKEFSAEPSSTETNPNSEEVAISNSLDQVPLDSSTEVVAEFTAGEVIAAAEAIIAESQLAESFEELNDPEASLTEVGNNTEQSQEIITNTSASEVQGESKIAEILDELKALEPESVTKEDSTETTHLTSVIVSESDQVPSTSDSEQEKVIATEEKAKLLTQLKDGEIEVTEPELKKGEVIVENLKDIGVSEDEATLTAVEVLSEPTYTLEEVGEGGEKQLIIEKIGQDIDIKMPVPVVDEEVNAKRKEISLEAISETVEIIEEHLAQNEIKVNKNQIWVSGKYVAEELVKNEVLSGILDTGPDGSNTKLAVDTSDEWVNLTTAPGKIDEGIRNNNAVKVAVTGELASSSEIQKVIRGKSAGIIYGPKL